MILEDWEFHFVYNEDYTLKEGSTKDAWFIEMLTGEMKGAMFEIKNLKFLEEGTTENGNAEYTYNAYLIPEGKAEDDLILLMNGIIPDVIVYALQTQEVVMFNGEEDYDVIE